MEPAIVCERLTKRYGSVLALDALDLTVPTGSIYGCLGPNGAGKTTLLRLLTGLSKPTAGRSSVIGLDIASQQLALHRRISTLEQQPQFYSWMRGRELLAFVGELYGLRSAELRRRIDEALETTGLTEAANRRIGGYSGGMRQRIGLAQALINTPEVLFLDEPVSALDPAGRHDILGVIEGLRGKVTVFMSSHILADVERICDQVAILNKGHLVVASSVAELQERYAQPVFTLEPEPGQSERVDRLVAALGNAPWTGQVVNEHGEIRIVARDPGAAMRELLPLVAQHGVMLQRFERGRPSLEDIFLRLVGDPATSTAEVA
jgi:ABC-2 type transport system ATP-binding protein